MLGSTAQKLNFLDRCEVNFSQVGCHSCHPIRNVKELKESKKNKVVGQNLQFCSLGLQESFWFKQKTGNNFLKKWYFINLLLIYKLWLKTYWGDVQWREAASWDERSLCVVVLALCRRRQPATVNMATVTQPTPPALALAPALAAAPVLAAALAAAVWGHSWRARWAEMSRSMHAAGTVTENDCVWNKTNFLLLLFLTCYVWNKTNNALNQTEVFTTCCRLLNCELKYVKFI